MGLLTRWRAASSAGPVEGDVGARGEVGYRVQSGDEALAPHQKTLGLIRHQVGVPEAHWNALYRTLFESFGAFVQQLPASEAHHHSGPGGMLAHGLQVTLSALTLRRGVLLPSGASAEELAEKQDVWTYAVGTAALLHDIGKPLCDQRVLLFDAAGKSLGDWDALAGAISAPAAVYQPQFRRGRRYRLHARLPPLLAHHILPAVGLRWLSTDLDVFEAWLATICGIEDEVAGELGKLIRSADGISVASDLTGTTVSRAAPGAPKPLAERMATALRFLVDEGRLPLNKPGAAGWVTEDALWLVSKRALDALREHLLGEAQGGVPSRNDRLMDELQGYGLLSANEDRAIWHASVRQGRWSVSLTLLRMPLCRLWPDAESRPPVFDGTVVPESNGIGADPADAADPTPLAVATTDLTPTDSQPASAQSAIPHGVEQRGASVEPDGSDEEQCHGRSLPELQSEFLIWLRDGIVSGRLKTNTAEARVHFVDDGLLLVSPAVFRDFAGVTGWEAAQKKLLKLRLHRKTAQGTNVWTYRVVGEKKSGALLRGIVLPDPETQLGIVVTRTNPVLHRVTDAGERAAEGPAEVFPVETPEAGRT